MADNFQSVVVNSKRECVQRVQNQSRQIESCANKDRVIDKNRVIQTEGSQANLIGGTLHSFGVFARETDSRCHFERLVQSARHWHWNEKEIPNKQLTWTYTYTPWVQHIQCKPQTVFLRHLHYCTHTYTVRLKLITEKCCVMSCLS